MKYKNKEYLKEQAIELYLKNNTYVQIAKILGCSRNYISDLIKDDIRIKSKKNKKTLKVYKSQHTGKKHLTIGIELLNNIGISNNVLLDEYVDVLVDSKNGQIVLTKHN